VLKTFSKASKPKPKQQNYENLFYNYYLHLLTYLFAKKMTLTTLKKNHSKGIETVIGRVDDITGLMAIRFVSNGATVHKVELKPEMKDIYMQTYREGKPDLLTGLKPFPTLESLDSGTKLNYNPKAKFVSRNAKVGRSRKNKNYTKR
jgi:hypothetical protein